MMSEKRDTLPQGWEWKKLGDIAFIKGGKRVPKGKKLTNVKTEYPYIRVTDFADDGTIDTTKIQYITEDIYNEIKNYTITCKDLYISIAGTIGKTGIIPKELDGANLTENAVKLVYKIQEIDNKFVYLFTLSNFFKEQAGLATKVVAMPKLAISRLSEIKIPLPPLEEQRRIVGVLDGLFGKIDKSIALLDESIASASSLMPSALNEVFNSNSIEQWEKYQFDKISKFIDYRGKTPVKTEEGIVLITAKNVRFGYLSNEPKEYIAHEDYEEWMTRGIPKTGDILFTTEAPLGNVALLNTDDKRAFAQRLVTFQAIGNEYNSNFLFWYLLSPYFQKELNKSATGTTVMGIKTAILKKFEIPLPPLDIQTQTVAYLDALHVKADSLKKAQEKKKEALLALKASLLESAFKGAL